MHFSFVSGQSHPEPVDFFGPAPFPFESDSRHIGFGGSCHWCTEAIFQSIRGVQSVRQGWISSQGEDSTASEAVLVKFDPTIVEQHLLIAAHLATHSSTSQHSFREKYRSAVYVFNDSQARDARASIARIQEANNERYVTRVIPFVAFTENQENQRDYYRTRPSAPFCSANIVPKLARLREKFPSHFINLNASHHS